MSRSYQPVANYTQPFWLSQQDNTPFSRYQSSESLPEKTDTLIIGSGFSGASTAYHLFHGDSIDPNQDVVMLEAREVCSGATGRNGGHVKPFGYRSYHQYESKYGLGIAAQVVNNEYDQLYQIKQLIEDEEIDCDFLLTRAFDVYFEESKFQEDFDSYKAMLKNPHVRQDIKNGIQIFRGDHVANLSKTKAKFGITQPAASVWPWKLVTQLLQITVSKGLKLYTNTPVTTFTKQNDGLYKVTTPKGEIITKNLVFTTNAYTKSLLPEFHDEIIPIKGAVTQIIPEKGQEFQQLSHTYAILKDEDDFDYLINRSDGSIIVGGGDFELVLDDKFNEVYDNPDDSYIVPNSKEYFHNYAQSYFKNWESLKTTNDYLWSGIMGYTKESLPFVGELDFLGYSNCFISAGFSGHGMPRVYLSGKSIANCLKTGESIAKVGEIPECYMINKERFEKVKESEHGLKKGLEEFIKKRTT